ncbi:MAG TPA: hypothetical protein VLM89_08210 [Phycisphaerae bacterium]|nr:hypothetical protein [Phycisphaerae bacterium]
MILLLVSVLLIALASPLVEILVRQVGEMIPDVGGRLWVEPYRAVEGILARGPGIRGVHVAFQALAARPAEPFDSASYRQLDRMNGLYDYMALIPFLHAGSDQDAVLRERVAELGSADRARLHLIRQYHEAERLFLQAGVPPRIAARGARRVPIVIPAMREPYPRVLRDFSAVLLARARSWREAGLGDDAFNAHAALVRLMDELVRDSNTPEVALLASEILPPVWRELEGDLEAGATTRPASGGLTEEVGRRMRQVALLRERWHAEAAEGTNVLPYTGMTHHVLLARREHQRVMATACMSALCLATWVVLLAAGVFWLVPALVVSNPAGIELRWRRRHVSWWVAPVAVALPTLLPALLLRGWQVDYSWVLSLPSIWAVLLWPAVVLVLLGLAVRWCTRVTGVAGKHLSPRGALVVVVVLLLSLVTLTLTPAGPPWMPPAEIRGFRVGGLALGAVSLLVLVVWIGAALSRGQRGRFSVFAWSRAYLHVTSAALAGMTILTMGALLANRQADLRHRQAFVRAAENPLADRLGSGWIDEYFGGSRELLNRIRVHRAGGMANSSRQ